MTPVLVIVDNLARLSSSVSQTSIYTPVLLVTSAVSGSCVSWKGTCWKLSRRLRF